MNGSKRNLLAMLVALAFGVLYQFMPLMAPPEAGRFDVESFSRLPSLYSGRYKPIDSIARDSLLAINGRQSYREGDTKMDAATWMLELAAQPEAATNRKVFRVDHPEVLSMLGLNPDRKRFSFNEIVANGAEVQRQLDLAQRTPQADRSLEQRKLLSLGEQLGLFQSLSNLFSVSLVPAENGESWTTLHDHAKTRTPAQEEIASRYIQMLNAFRADDATTFNAHVAALGTLLRVEAPAITTKAAREATLNRLELFPRASVLYVITGLLIMISWLKWGDTLLSAATSLVMFALVVHTAGLIARIYLSGRPPVTNLYSSAIFIGWGSVVTGLVLERLFKNGLGVTLAAVMGFMSLLVAQGLTGNGDTMAVLQAVLDTNFWLATHVVVITLGYSAAYLAGFLGIAYVLRGVFSKTLHPEDAKRLGQMIYGVVCFATLLSFIGTILGGIWADQSWGRFWGWDPKENGALIIVLWNAMILHARWGGMVRHRGVAVLAIAGNIVVSWSWFGVNMLGKGLHSYGFMDSAVFWLGAFVVSQVLLVCIGVLPHRAWRSRPWGSLPGDRPDPKGPKSEPASA